MTFKWDENVTQKFLEEYKKHECLWNQNSAEYYNCFSKKEAIRTIIDKLNIPFLTPAECQHQIETITKKYEQEQSKTLYGLCSGKPYKSKLPWYPLMQEMLTKTISNGINETPKVTICTNSLPDKKKKTQISNKKKSKSNVLSPATQVTTNNPCGYKVIKKVVKEKDNHLGKKGKKKIMSDNYTNYVPCPGIGKINSITKLNDGREVENNSRSETGLSNNLLDSICVREIKRRRDIPRINLPTKSTECSSCYRQNLESNHYAAKGNSNYSNFCKQNNSDLTYNESRNQGLYDQHRFRTKYVPCPNSLKSPDPLFSTNQRNSYSYLKNMQTYSPERIVCGNNFHKATELCPRQFQEFPEPDVNLNKNSCLRSVDKFLPTSDEQGIVQFTPRVATKFENGIFEAFSQFKISIQCGEKGQDNKNIHPSTNRETQTFLDRKQQSVCTNLVHFDTKETQCEDGKKISHSKQIGTDFEDCNKEIQNTVCVSRHQADKMKNNPSDYVLLMPGGKSLRLAKTSSEEKFVECPGVSENRFVDDEALSVCTEASCMTQESRFADSESMTTPQLLQCVEEMLNIKNNTREIQVEEVESLTSSRAENREEEEKESQCEACKNSENEDEDLRFCFKKLFNKNLSKSDCFPCLKEKIDKESTSELTKTFLTILKYALDLDNKAENNLKGCRLRSKSKTEMIERICKCIKKLSEIEAARGTKSKKFLSKNTQIEENRKHSKEVATEKEPSISRSVNAITKNIYVTKQIETENEAKISRSMNTIADETPVEITQTILENVETNTDFPNLRKDVGTNPVKNVRIGELKSIGTQKRDPILVRVVSATDRQKIKTTQSKSSQSSQSSEEVTKLGCKRVCFNEKKTEFENPKKDFRCQKECSKLPKNNWSKIRIALSENSRIKKKVLDKKVTDVPKSKSLINKKIFFSDFCV